MSQFYSLPCTLRHFGVTNVKIYTRLNPIMNRATNPTNGKASTAELWDECLHKMRTILKSRRAVGISAPQLGYDLCLIGWQSIDHRVNFLYNPRFKQLSEATFSLEEGCLSSPGERHVVTRFKNVLVDGYDLDLKAVAFKAHKLDAAIIQHEIDHLNGRPWPPISP